MIIKRTYSGRWLYCLSNHPNEQEIAMVKNLVGTVILLSDESFHKENLKAKKSSLFRKILRLMKN